ncbi:MAG TPA: tetratricopeptide repeat protein [Pirellulales bacterium]|nr:tetratricopeptide repeat protein [Pirellulales bacterium]
MVNRIQILEKWGVERGQMLRVWLPAACAVAMAAAMFWSLSRRPDVNFLTDRPPAHWIVYRAVPDLAAQPDGPRRTVFHRQFSVAKLPAASRLTVQALNEFAVTVNGVEVAKSDASQSWKTPQTTVVGGDLLQVGENELEVTVTCQRGPPALCLALDVGSEIIASDDRWQASLLGAMVQPARLAAAVPAFGKGTAPAGAERPIDSLVRTWPRFLIFGVLAAVAVGLGQRYGERMMGTRVSANSEWLVLAAIALTWLALLIWNARSLTFLLGFDSPFHLEYVEHIQHKGTLPTGVEGAEMWQPPLYYLSVSLLTSLAGAAANSELGILVERAFAYVVSLTQLLLLAGCLRRLFPGPSGPRSVGLLFAGCLPVQLYMMHYNSNDVLAAALSTAALYTAIAVIQLPRARISPAMVLGVCLGTAVLTKLTTWPVVLVIMLVLVWQLAAERRAAREWIVRLGVPVCVCLFVCGWYFLRNYRNFGRPLPPDQAGWTYGQDPGYAMLPQFVRFGQSLAEPFYSAFAGLPDGIYSTLWGDGDWGGKILLETRPPWNYDLMAGNYLLAIVPTLLLFVGSGSLVWQVLRRWQPEKLLLLGAGVASFCGLAYFYLLHPMYGAIKAHYALPSIASLCVLTAEGYVVLSGKSPARQAAIATALGAWGLAALASFSVGPSSPQTNVWVARQFTLQGNLDQAWAKIKKAIRQRPDDLRLRLMEGRVLAWGQRYEEARGAMAAVVQTDPTNVEAQVWLAEVLIALGRDEESVPLLENSLRLAPDYGDAYRQLALLNLRQSHVETAREVALAGLRVAPHDPLLHLVLGEAFAQLGEQERAIEHYRIAVEFNPQYTPALGVLASIYATHPEARYRNAQQAVELARRASQLTEHEDPLVEDTLAAAYAEAGDFAAAEQTLRAAIERMTPDEAGALRERLADHLDRIKSRKPLRDYPYQPKQQAGSGPLE